LNITAFSPPIAVSIAMPEPVVVVSMTIKTIFESKPMMSMPVAMSIESVVKITVKTMVEVMVAMGEKAVAVVAIVLV